MGIGPIVYGSYLRDEKDGSFTEYIIQEYIAGVSLELLPNGIKKDIPAALELYRQLLLYGYDHGDLDPSNVLYSNERKKYYLIDYGCATLYMLHNRKIF